MNTLRKILVAAFVLTLLSVAAAFSQVWPPEGMNMPGAYDGWNNPPTINSLAGVQKVGGTFLLDSTSFWRRYSTLIHVNLSSADFAGGTYEWLFTSGPPPTGYFSNKWGSVTVSLDSIQTYTKEGSNNSVTVNDGKYYTVNFRDNGYANTQASWLETSNPPVSITSVTQNPLPGAVTSGDPVTVTVTYNTTPSGEENTYIRWTTNNFASSSLAAVTLVSASYEGTIPGQAGGTEVKYYVFTTKRTDPVSDFDLVTLQYNNNSGVGYSYTIPAADLTISASAGPHGTIDPSGDVIVSSGGSQTFNFYPDGDYYVDSIIVDNMYAGDSSYYTFTNVLVNHTIRVVFARNVNVTFQVNMAQKQREGAFAPDSGDIVSVNGGFNDWTPGVDTCTATVGDSIYTKVKSLKVGLSFEYKFWKTDRGGLAWEDHVANRPFTVPDVDTVIPAPYFDNDVPPSPPVNVTFQVNMGVQMLKGAFRPDTGGVVLVRGSFNGWGTPDTLRDPNDDSIFTKVVSIPGDQTIEYKFWKSDTNESNGYEGNISNRTCELTLSDTTLDAVYFDDQESFMTNVSVEKGWNMISLARIVEDPTKTALFPTATSRLFVYTGSYQPKDTLELGTGYWLKFGNSEVIPINGLEVNNLSIPVNPGWNMIGSLSMPIPISNITSDPPGMITSNFFAYTGRYILADTILPSQGYWVKVNGAGNLILSEAPSAAELAKNAIRIVPTGDMPPAAPNEGASTEGAVPKQFALEQAYPNPFNPTTSISYELPINAVVTMKVFNALGQEVATLVNEAQNAGYHSVRWNAATGSGASVASGVYIYVMSAVGVADPGKSFTQARKMLLMK